MSFNISFSGDKNLPFTSHFVSSTGQKFEKNFSVQELPIFTQNEKVNAVMEDILSVDVSASNSKTFASTALKTRSTPYAFLKRCVLDASVLTVANVAANFGASYQFPEAQGTRQKIFFGSWLGQLAMIYPYEKAKQRDLQATSELNLLKLEGIFNREMEFLTRHHKTLLDGLAKIIDEKDTQIKKGAQLPQPDEGQAEGSSQRVGKPAEDEKEVEMTNSLIGAQQFAVEKEGQVQGQKTQHLGKKKELYETALTQVVTAMNFYRGLKNLEPGDARQLYAQGLSGWIEPKEPEAPKADAVVAPDAPPADPNDPLALPAPKAAPKGWMATGWDGVKAAPGATLTALRHPIDSGNKAKAAIAARCDIL